MVVTAVEPRRKSFSALYIDGEFAMKLDTETLLANHIRAGVEIDDEDGIVTDAEIKKMLTIDVTLSK